MLTMKTKGMKKEIRGVILHDEMLNGILVEEGEGYLGKQSCKAEACSLVRAKELVRYKYLLLSC